MQEFNNALLPLTREIRNSLPAGIEMAPMSMPRREDRASALDRIAGNGQSPEISGDPTLSRGLLQISEVNRLVSEHAMLPPLFAENEANTGSTSYEFAIALQPRSGEMTCPECRKGNLCYLIGRNGGAFVECSTQGCLYWDSRR